MAAVIGIAIILIIVVPTSYFYANAIDKAIKNDLWKWHKDEEDKEQEKYLKEYVEKKRQKAERKKQRKNRKGR